jgi:hypothetical protein
VSYIDRGPADPFRLRKPSLDALVCDRRTATVFGTAKVGAGPVVNFRMDLGDRAEPQHVDTYRILLSNGYDSGTQRVRSGSVVVRAG